MRDLLLIVQGDSTQWLCVFDHVPSNYIAEAKLTCRSLNVNKEMSHYQDEFWIVRFTPEETAEMRVGNFEYDVTIKLNDGTIYTPIYRGIMEVKHKTNKVW